MNATSTTQGHDDSDPFRLIETTAAAELGHVNGWTFDPAREVWFARTGAATWTEVRGALDDPPRFAPAPIVDFAPRDSWTDPSDTDNQDPSHA